MQFSPELAEIRFGCGLSPSVAPPAGAAEMLARLQAPDRMAAEFPVMGFDAAYQEAVEYLKLRKTQREIGNGDGKEAARAAFVKKKRELNRARLRWLGQNVLRWSRTGDGFRERLTGFWTDHFTAKGKRAAFRHLAGPYAETAIRPFIAGRFEDLLISSATSPLMLHYLDQGRSAGPGSAVNRRSGGKRGLNENLAREVLELHTLGVGAPYTQTDVRELAELFTGLSFSTGDGFKFRSKQAEPGPETVLGKTYGGHGEAKLEPVLQALRDLAVHPATARHIAWKLAVHFVADEPEQALVDHVAARFVETGGDLAEVYGALLEHPAAWQSELRNVKPPFDYIASACRALDLTPAAARNLRPGVVRRLLIRPMALMGQSWRNPAGPDGFSEQDTAWITPQGLAARLGWAMLAPPQLSDPLPDPRRFAAQSLGVYADARVMFAAGAAETQAEAIGLVLASPAFQRR